MRRVYKYPVSDIEGSIKVPNGYKILYFNMQYNYARDKYTPTVWMEVDPSEPEVEFNYSIFGTGWEINIEAEYIGTCMDGVFVWHLYRRN